MGFFVSPGVQVQEYEVASNTLTSSSSPVGYVGVFEWGPIDEIVNVGSKVDLKKYYGTPSAKNARSWYIASNFLDYSSNLNIVRAINTEYAKNATVGAGRELAAAGITSEQFNKIYELTEEQRAEIIRKIEDDSAEGLTARYNAAETAKDVAIEAYNTAATTYDEAITAEETAVRDYNVKLQVFTAADENFSNATTDFNSANTAYEQALEAYNAAVAADADDPMFEGTTKEAKVTELEEAKNDASDIKDAAQTELNDAQAAKTAAQTELTAAETAKNNAETSKNTAQEAKEAAETAKNNAVTSYNKLKAEFNDANDKKEVIENFERIQGNLTLVKNVSDWSTKYADGSADAALGEFVAKYPSDIGNNIAVYMADSATYGAVTSVKPNVVSYIYDYTKDEGKPVEFDESPYGIDFTAKGTIVLDPTPNKDGKYAIKAVKITDPGKYTELGKYVSPPKCKFPRPEGAKNNNGVPIAVVEIWKYARNFMSMPGTSEFVKQRGGKDDEIHLVVVDETGVLTGTRGTILESFANLSKAADAKFEDGTSAYYPNVLRDKSNYVFWLNHPELGTNWGSFARGTTFTTLGFEDGEDYTFESGYKGVLGGGFAGTDYVDSYNRLAAWDNFADPERTDVSILMSGDAELSEQQYLISLCESRKDCIVVISPRYTDVINDHEDSIKLKSIIMTRDALKDSTYAFMDSNWKYAYDAYNDQYLWIPCNSDIAGIMAQTDDQYAAWWSPAGVNRGLLKNVVRLAWNPDGSSRDVLYQNAVNPVCTFLAEGTVLYGDRTMIKRQNSPFQNINARRLLIILEKTISRAAKSILFEFNDTTTRSRFVQIVEPYLESVQAARGMTDYMLVCDNTNNTPDIVAQNALVADIYVKPTKTVNFVKLNFVCVASDVSFDEIVGNFQ